MSEKHRKSCKVFVGDVLPEMELSDLPGKKRKLSTDDGKKLTVICMFGGKLPTEDQELIDLTTEVVDRYGKGAGGGDRRGRRPVERYRGSARIKKLGVKIPAFVDTDRKAYDSVATDYLPRTYLSMPQEKILWLDMVYGSQHATADQ